MARRPSYIPLKRRTPKWYCVNRKYGKVQNMVTYPRPLFYVTDPREMKAIKKLLGNPAFFSEYQYLLVTKDEIGEFSEIFGVISSSPAAFSGDVERVLFGWAPDKRHYDAILEGSEVGDDEDESAYSEENGSDSDEPYEPADDEIT